MLCVICNVICCYFITISGLEGLVTTNAQTKMLGIGPKCGPLLDQLPRF